MVRLLMTLLLGGLLTTALPAQNLGNMIQLKMDKRKNRKAMAGVHEAHLGEIVFAAERIPFQHPQAGDFLTDYTWGKSLYMRTYWGETLEEAYKADFAEQPFLHAIELYRVYVDGEAVYDHLEYSLNRTDGVVTWYTTWGALHTGGATVPDNYIVNDALRTALAKAAPTAGTHTVTLENYVYDIATEKVGKKLAEGTLHVTLTAADVAALPAADSGSPACMPRPAQTNEAYAADMLAAAEAMDWPETFRHVVILDRDFTINRHAVTGVIESRSLRAAVGARRDGACYFQRFVFFQDYTGSGYADHFKLATNLTGEQSPVPCACLFGE